VQHAERKLTHLTFILAYMSCIYVYTHCITELEGYIRAQGSSVLAFYDAIRTASERDPLSSEAIFGQIMAATADFDIFMQVCVTSCNRVYKSSYT
jgi:hypothetical protein